MAAPLAEMQSCENLINEVRSMLQRKKPVCSSAFLMAIACCLLITQTSEACTRVVYLGPEGSVITARSMDWKVDVGTNLWILPRGTVARNLPSYCTTCRCLRFEKWLSTCASEYRD